MPPSTAELVSFGPFLFCPSQRLLTKDGEPVKLGGRAFDLLTILVENAGDVVSHQALLERAWPGIFVEDISLRVRIADLRKVLEHDTHERYLVNVPGRGYSFVGRVSRQAVEAQTEAATARYNLPPLPAFVVGRDEPTREIRDALLARRFLTIVGPGGVGKTTVAVSVAWTLLDDFKGQVCFVELSPLGQPSLLAATVVSAFGLPVSTSDPIAALAKRLSGQRILLVLDSAEHLVAEAAMLTERLFAELPNLHILITTREALRVQGEIVYLLPALDSPPNQPGLTLAEVGTYSAARLFLERCSTVGVTQRFSDADAPAIAGMCRALGGLALALELAAGRVSTFGLSGTAGLLSTEFALRWPGRRTAPPRHQTLTATLDWSYNLLSGTERIVLRRLSVFAGRFTLPSARCIASHTDIADQDVLDALNGLAAKSLVSVGASDGTPWFRLLDTTRQYAMGKLVDTGELDALRRRQATYYRDVLREAAGDAQAMSDSLDIDDIRAALRWSFGKDGDERLGADLAAGSAFIWFRNAMLGECHAWMSRAAEVYAKDSQAAEQLLAVLVARGSVELMSGEFSKELTDTWTRSLALSEAAHDAPRQFFAYLALWTRDIRETWYADALAMAERSAQASDVVNDPHFRPAVEWFLGHTLHHLGQQEAAEAHFNASLDCDTHDAQLVFIRATGIDRRTDLLGILANTMWLRGRADQAAEMGKQALAEARALQLDMSIGPAMIWAGLNRYLSDPDLAAIELAMVELLEHGRSHAVDTEVAFALSILGLCQARQGDYGAGRRSVEEGLRLFAETHLETFSPIVLAHLCEAAINAHQLDDASELMTALKARDRNPEHFCTPEILRVRALLSIAHGDARSGEDLFRKSLTMAGEQSALAWELRTAISASTFLISQGRTSEALEMLALIYDRFTEGLESADCRVAQETLSKLDRRRFPPVHQTLN